MQGAGRAIGWEFARHHRLGFGLLAAYFAGFWLIRRWLVGSDVPIKLDPPDETAGLLIMPFSFGACYFIGAFSYGLSGDLAARESAFPRRMFTLPVSTRALAWWPMFHGTLASVALWLMMCLLLRSSGGTTVELSWIWPALLLAVFLAWMQAMTWLSYPLRGLRIVVAVLLLTAVDAAMMLEIYFHASDAVMVAILAPQIVVAYLVAWWAVAGARRGEVPDWSGWLNLGSGSVAAKPLFPTPGRAQAWLEWHQHGRTLPILVAFVVPCELGLLYLPGNEGAGMIFVVLFTVLITPPAMALMAAPALSTFSTHAATRPLTNAALVAAKLEMTLWSTLAAWGLTAVFSAGALVLSGAMPVVVEKLRDFAEFSGTARAIVVPLLVIAALVGATWKNLVQSLCIGLTARPWVVRSSVIVALTLITLAFPVFWVVLWRDSVQSLVFDWMPWVLVALVWLKVSAAAWNAARLRERKVFGDRAIVAGALTWLAAVAAVYGVLAWITATPTAPFYFLGSIAILMVPLVRLSAAPLALAVSRHR